MSEAGQERATSGRTAGEVLAESHGLAAVPAISQLAFARLTLAARPLQARCNRCNFPVLSKPWGCKNPCANCGTVYPLGDCSD